MASRAGVFLSLFLVCVLISAGCVSPPKDNGGQSDGASNTNTNTLTKTTTPTVTPEQLPHYPLFKVGQIALKSDGASSGLAIVDIRNSIQMYGTKEVKKGYAGTYYTDGEKIVVWKKIADIDKNYRFSTYGGSPAHFSISKSGFDYTVPLSNPCDALGDWNMKDGSVYRLRYDGIVVRQKGDEKFIGTWRQARTSDGRTYVLSWQYGPGEGYPLYVEEIELSSDLSKFSGTNNYGEKSTGTWAFTGGTIPAHKSCSDWPGGNDWYK